MENLTWLAAPVSARVEVKKSIFLGVVAPVDSVAEAEALLSRVRKEHYSARHHCSAMILGNSAQIQRSNDDGEPAGSAGAPILAVLRHHQLTDVIAVVTRYFGGTLLGVGGLVRAYTEAVVEALAQSSIISYSPATNYLVTCGYEVLGDFEQMLRLWLTSHKAELTRASYDPAPLFQVLIGRCASKDFLAMLAPWLRRGVQVTELGESRIRI